MTAYMVSYFHRTKNGFGFGRCRVELRALTIEAIRQIEDDVIAANGFEGVSVIAVVRLDA